MVREVVGARGASLGVPYGRTYGACRQGAGTHCCVAVDESRGSLAARCVSFCQIVWTPAFTLVSIPQVFLSSSLLSVCRKFQSRESAVMSSRTCPLSRESLCLANVPSECTSTG